MKKPISVLVRDYVTKSGLHYIVFERFYIGRDGTLKGKNLFKTSMEDCKNSNMTNNGLRLLALVQFYLEKPEIFDRDVAIYFDDEVVVENVRKVFGELGAFSFMDVLGCLDSYEEVMRSFYTDKLTDELIDMVDEALNILRSRERRLSFHLVDEGILKALDLVWDE